MVNKNPTTPCICCYTILCETLMSVKQAINDKLQGSVATHLRCGGWLIKNLRKVYCWVWEWKKVLKSVNIWQSYKPRTWLFRALLPSFISVLAKSTSEILTLVIMFFKIFFFNSSHRAARNASFTGDFSGTFTGAGFVFLTANPVINDLNVRGGTSRARPASRHCQTTL